jgi:hypothetical protein
MLVYVKMLTLPLQKLRKTMKTSVKRVGPNVRDFDTTAAWPLVLVPLVLQNPGGRI